MPLFWVEPNPEPVKVTCVPTAPDVGETAVMFGATGGAGAGKTDMESVPVTFQSEAVIVALPTPMATPVPWTLSMFTTDTMVPSDEFHETMLVMSRVVPSLNVPLAVNCWVVPSGSDGSEGDTMIETSDGTVTVVEPDKLPSWTETVVVPTFAALITPVFDVT